MKAVFNGHYVSHVDTRCYNKIIGVRWWASITRRPRILSLYVVFSLYLVSDLLINRSRVRSAGVVIKTKILVVLKGGRMI